jgi:hypothetical protein
VMKTKLVFVVSLLAGSAIVGQEHPTGPPSFVTFPILNRVALTGLEGGHLVWTGEGFAPTPLAWPQPGATNVPSATFLPSGSPIQSEADVSNSGGSYQGETGAASNTAVIVSGSNFIYPGQCSSLPCYVGAFTWNGSAWTTAQLSGTWNNTKFGITFDPALDTDTAGNFYYVFGGAPLSGSYPNSIAVAKTDPSGLGWNTATPVAVTFNRNRYFDDKYYIAVDRSSSSFANRIYVSWDRNTSTNQTLYIAYSSNGGATWSAPIKVNDGTSSFERVIGAYPAVDHATGTVYDSWHDYAKGKIFVDKSTTGGASWGKDVAAATTHTGFGQDIGCNGGRSQSPAHHLKVGASGVLHLVYADNVAGRGFDILYTRSTNGGATWSVPVRLNDDSGPAHQYHPTLAVSGSTVTVTFYDRRDDSNNCASQVYATQSTDGGLNWSANVKLSTAASNFDGNPNGPGDYSSSIPFGGTAHAFHSDHRTSDFEVYGYEK